MDPCPLRILRQVALPVKDITLHNNPLPSPSQSHRITRKAFTRSSLSSVAHYLDLWRLTDGLSNCSSKPHLVATASSKHTRSKEVRASAKRGHNSSSLFHAKLVAIELILELSHHTPNCFSFPCAFSTRTTLHLWSSPFAMRGKAYSKGPGLTFSWLALTTSLLAGSRLCSAITLYIDDPGMLALLLPTWKWLDALSASTIYG